MMLRVQMSDVKNQILLHLFCLFMNKTEAELRSEIGSFIQISFLHVVSPDALNKAEKCPETSSVLF